MGEKIIKLVKQNIIDLINKRLTNSFSLFNKGFPALLEGLIYIKKRDFIREIRKTAAIENETLIKLIAELGFVLKQLHNSSFFYIDPLLIDKYKLIGVEKVHPYCTMQYPMRMEKRVTDRSKQIETRKFNKKFL